MTNHLLLGTSTDNLVLADTENPSEVLHRLDEARRKNVATHINAIVPGSKGVQIVSVNPSNLNWWAVIGI